MVTSMANDEKSVRETRYELAALVVVPGATGLRLSLSLGIWSGSIFYILTGASRILVVQGEEDAYSTTNDIQVPSSFSRTVMGAIFDSEQGDKTHLENRQERIRHGRELQLFFYIIPVEASVARRIFDGVKDEGLLDQHAAKPRSTHETSTW